MEKFDSEYEKFMIHMMEEIAKIENGQVELIRT